MLNFSHGAVQWLTSQVLNTTIAVTGLGFSPKAIRFYWVGLQSNSPTAANSQAVAERRGVGFASSTTSRHAVGTFSADNSGNADCGSVWISDGCVVTVDGTGLLDGRLDISSIDADGFTLIVDDVAPANITVFWEAWGGSEISNVTIGAIAEPAAIGSQDYTATGFVPYNLTSEFRNDQCVMFAGVQTVNASGTGQAQDSGLCIGCATGDGVNNQFLVVGNSDDGSATMDTDGYGGRGSCLGMVTIAGGNLNSQAALFSFGTDIFTLDWSTRTTTNRRNIYMAIKGGSWQAEFQTIEGSTLNSTTTIQNLSFNIRGVSIVGAMRTLTIGLTTTLQDRIGFGSGLSPTSRNSAGINDVDNIATSNIATSVNYSQVLVYPSTTGTLQTAYDISALSANSITLITDTAGGVSSEAIFLLLFGDKKPRTVSIGHPFIN